MWAGTRKKIIWSRSFLTGSRTMREMWPMSYHKRHRVLDFWHCDKSTWDKSLFLRSCLFWLSFRSFSPLSLVHVALGLWRHSTSWWEYVVKEAERERKGPHGPLRNTPDPNRAYGHLFPSDWQPMSWQCLPLANASQKPVGRKPRKCCLGTSELLWAGTGEERAFNLRANRQILTKFFLVAP